MARSYWLAVSTVLMVLLLVRTDANAEETEQEGDLERVILEDPLSDGNAADPTCRRVETAGQQEQQQQQHEDPVEPPSLYDMGFTVMDIKGSERQLSELRGKVTLVVNVASQCGYTQSNYQLLQQVYEKYSISGLEILAFPCNQFGAQEPGGEAEIEAFVESNYHVTFPLMSKVEVNGESASPVFKFLKMHAPPLEGHPPNADLSWNFNKFLVDKWGRPVKRYGPDLVLWQLEGDIYNELIREYPGGKERSAEEAPGEATKDEL